METNARWSPPKGRRESVDYPRNLSKFLQTFSTCAENNGSRNFSKIFPKDFFFFFGKFVVRSTKLVLSRLNRASNKSDEDTEKGSRIKMIVLSFQITGARLGRRASSTRR